MNKTKRSLSDQNMGGRAAGDGLSPSALTKAKTKLWNKLRKLDRAISKTHYFRWAINSAHSRFTNVKDKKEYDKLDQRRKEVRAKLKNS